VLQRRPVGGGPFSLCVLAARRSCRAGQELVSSPGRMRRVGSGSSVRKDRIVPRAIGGVASLREACGGKLWGAVRLRAGSPPLRRVVRVHSTSMSSPSRARTGFASSPVCSETALSLPKASFGFLARLFPLRSNGPSYRIERPSDRSRALGDRMRL
jgi:hypothetical protein